MPFQVSISMLSVPRFMSRERLQVSSNCGFQTLVDGGGSVESRPGARSQTYFAHMFAWFYGFLIGDRYKMKTKAWIECLRAVCWRAV